MNLTEVARSQMNARRLRNESEEKRSDCHPRITLASLPRYRCLTRSASGGTSLSSSDTEMSTTPESPMPVLVQPFAGASLIAKFACPYHSWMSTTCRAPVHLEAYEPHNERGCCRRRHSVSQLSHTIAVLPIPSTLLPSPSTRGNVPNTPPANTGDEEDPTPPTMTTTTQPPPPLPPPYGAPPFQWAHARPTL